MLTVDDKRSIPITVMAKKAAATEKKSNDTKKGAAKKGKVDVEAASGTEKQAKVSLE